MLYAIDNMVPLGSTNIAESLEQGIEVLEPTGDQYGRPLAARYIILLTDGVPNRWPGYEGPGDQRYDGHPCHAEDLWEDDESNIEESFARDCTIYYAEEARGDEIVVFTIGLGVAVDGPLLEEVAQRTGGAYYAVTSGEDLEAVFDEIANRINLRLVE